MLGDHSYVPRYCRNIEPCFYVMAGPASVRSTTEEDSDNRNSPLCRGTIANITNTYLACHPLVELDHLSHTRAKSKSQSFGLSKNILPVALDPCAETVRVRMRSSLRVDTTRHHTAHTPPNDPCHSVLLNGPLQPVDDR